MQFLVDNYIVVIGIGLFILFALVGYLVDSFKNIKDKEDTKTDEIELSSNTDPNINKNKESVVKEELLEDSSAKELDDDLLYNYDHETK